jgi:multiple sugar transport system substrate-binding protein
MEIILKGLTWDHPRGYSPLIGGAPEYEAQNPGIRIRWDRRSLRDFGEAPIEQYIADYDLIVVDHPFVGFAAVHGALIDLASHISSQEKLAFEQDSVGTSWQSYWYRDGLWAFPLDAATQVSCYRPDLLSPFMSKPPATFEEVLAFAGKARAAGKFVIVPACPTDAISLFFTLSASLGHPIHENAEPFVAPSVGREVLQKMSALVSAAHPSSGDWNPIQVYDFMIGSSDAIYCPYGFGYSNYARTGNKVTLKFGNTPAVSSLGSSGTMLGGTGIAVSSQTAHPAQAIAYAKWLASQEHQRGTYFTQGGQPASLSAWRDSGVNAASGDFFSGTLQTLKGAYVRPRFDGFVRFFEKAGIEINRWLRGLRSDDSLLTWLDAEYALVRPKL